MRTFCLVAVATGLALAPRPVAAAPLTLADALARASQRPDIAIAGASVDAARGDRAQAQRPLYNPELSAAIGPRLDGGDLGVAAEVGVAQLVERGGKRAARVASAAAREDAAAAALAVTRQRARLDAWEAFHLALVGRARVEAAQALEELARELAEATTTRQGLGGGTQLEVNLTLAELGRARHERLDAEAALDRDHARLASAIGAGADEVPTPVGALPTFAAVPLDEAGAAARALAARPELRVVAAALDVARADRRLADAQAAVDVQLGVSYGLEQAPGATSHVVLFGASLGLPVRNRWQGARAAAQARVRGAELDRQWAGAEVEREARLAQRVYARALAAVSGFDRDVTDHLSENLALARDSLASGKLDYFQFTQVRRELFASRMAYLDAVAEAISARVGLARAIGEELP